MQPENIEPQRPSRPRRMGTLVTLRVISLRYWKSLIVVITNRFSIQTGVFEETSGIFSPMDPGRLDFDVFKARCGGACKGGRAIGHLTSSFILNYWVRFGVQWSEGRTYVCPIFARGGEHESAGVDRQSCIRLPLRVAHDPEDTGGVRGCHPVAGAGHRRSGSGDSRGRRTGACVRVGIRRLSSRPPRHRVDPMIALRYE